MNTEKPEDSLSHKTVSGQSDADTSATSPSHEPQDMPSDSTAQNAVESADAIDGHFTNNNPVFDEKDVPDNTDQALQSAQEELGELPNTTDPHDQETFDSDKDLVEPLIDAEPTPMDAPAVRVTTSEEISALVLEIENDIDTFAGEVNVGLFEPGTKSLAGRFYVAIQHVPSTDNAIVWHDLIQIGEQLKSRGMEDIARSFLEKAQEALPPSAVVQSEKKHLLPVKAAPVIAPQPFLFGEAVRYMREAEGDLVNFADQISAGEFSENGAGNAGRIWRAIANTSEADMHEVWGEIIAISTGLWTVERRTEAILFIEQAKRHFFIPDAWQERVEKSLTDAKNYNIVAEAEKAFEEGRDDEAIQYSKSITAPEGQEYTHDIEIRSKKRKKQRKIAFIGAGITIAVLIASSVVAITTMDEMSLTPPAPDFTGMSNTLESTSEALRQEREARDNSVEGAVVDPLPNTAIDNANATPPVAPTADPIVAPNPAAAESGVSQTEGGIIAAPTNPVAAPTNPTTAPTDPLAAPAQSTALAPVTTPVQPTPQAPVAQPAPQAAAPQAADPGMIESCILGYTVLTTADTMSAAMPGDARARFEEFSQTLATACDQFQIPMTDIIRGATTFNQTDVTDMARNILLGQ